MRCLIFLAIIIFTGCSTNLERQHASNAIAGCDGSVMILNRALQERDITLAHALIQAAIDVQRATTPRIENAVSTPRVDLPPPAITASQIDKDHTGYTSTTPPSPAPGGWGAGLIGGLTAAGLVAFGIARKIAPLIPGVGTIWGSVIETGYSILAHADQKKADEVATTTKAAATAALPIIELVAMNHMNLPQEIKDKLTPERLQALTTLVTVLADKQGIKP